jgi:cytochrome c biogenesis protein CcdA
MTMDIEELKRTWTQMECRLDRLEARAGDDRRSASRRALRWLSGWEVVKIAIWILFVSVVAPFWIEHRHTAHLLVAGLVLHAYGVAVIVIGSVQLSLVGRLYYTVPVLVMQQRIAGLRRFRVRNSLLLGVPWWLLWVPCTMVGAMRLFAVDLYAASPAWIYASLAIGMLGLVASLWLARRLVDRSISSPWLKRMIDDLAGASLRRAAREIDDLASFARE